MRQLMVLASCALLGLLALAARSMAATPPASTRPPAGLIVSRLKMTKGLGLDLGCGDGRLALDIARQTQLRITCVDSDPEAVARARQAIDAAGLYGTRVSADLGDLASPAYPSYCASLIICGDELANGLRNRRLTEIRRLLHPQGVAVIGQSAETARTAKQRLTRATLEGWLKDAGITQYEIVEENGIWAIASGARQPGWDEWTHRSHDPSNTHASNDTVAGADLKLLWSAPCQPGLASATVLAADNKLIEIGRGYAGHPDTTPYLQVSDAFTGIPLWSKIGAKETGIDRPLANYSPIESCSDVAAADGCLYLLGGKFCHVLDLATGEEKARYALPEAARAGPDEIWLHLASLGDALYGSAGPSPRHTTPGFGGWGGPHWRGITSSVFSLDRRTGRSNWVVRTPAETASIAMGENKLYFIDPGKRIHCLDSKTGAESWSAPTDLPAQGRVTRCACYRGRLWVLFSADKDVSSKARDAGWGLACFSAADGSLVAKPELTGPVASLTFAQDTVYTAPEHATGFLYKLDAQTARLAGTMVRGQTDSKCTPILATPNYLFYRHACGSGFTRIGRQTGQQLVFDRIRCTCHLPGLPANGLLYIQGPGCNCAHPFRANVALVPGRREIVEPADSAARLTKGEAFGQAVREGDAATAWPTWRADNTRGGQTAQAPRLPLKAAWTFPAGTRLTPVSAADGLVFFGADDRKFRALDAADGKLRWQFIASGRIRIAPYWWRSRIFFGDDDGWAYCLRAADGKLIWRFRAALGQERVVADGDFMSAWPAGNGVLVHQDVAYVAAGFFPGEGGRLHALDALTGNVLWTQDRRGQRALDSTAGAMAVGGKWLYLPTQGGPPVGIDLESADHRGRFNLNWQGAFSPVGVWIMPVGEDVIAGSPDLQFIHHATTYNDLRKALPIVTDEAIYLRDGRFLSADRRAAYKPHPKCGDFTWVESQLNKRVDSPRREDSLWRAQTGTVMSAVIKAGDILFSAGGDQVYATDAKTGRELWKAPTPGVVADLAFQGQRLLVVLDQGGVIAFEPATIAPAPR